MTITDGCTDIGIMDLRHQPSILVELKQWLEGQFKELHDKMDNISSNQQRLESLVCRRRSKKSDQPSATPSVAEEEVDDTSGMRVCCGKGGVKGKHVYLTLPSEAALAAFSLLNSAPPADPAWQFSSPAVNWQGRIAQRQRGGNF